MYHRQNEELSKNRFFWHFFNRKNNCIEFSTLKREKFFSTKRWYVSSELQTVTSYGTLTHVIRSIEALYPVLRMDPKRVCFNVWNIIAEMWSVLQKVVRFASLRL
jgi:hypothetical protein